MSPKSSVPVFQQIADAVKSAIDKGVVAPGEVLPSVRQMAAQGQSIYAASGDSGAYDNGSTLSVDDPASQPFMVGVGGTRTWTLQATGGSGNQTFTAVYRRPWEAVTGNESAYILTIHIVPT